MLLELTRDELEALFLGIVFIVPTVIVFRAAVPRLRFFLGAIVFSLLASFFAVVEHVSWSSGFDYLQHACYALAALFLAIGAWTLGHGGAGRQ